MLDSEINPVQEECYLAVDPSGNLTLRCNRLECRRGQNPHISWRAILYDGILPETVVLIRAQHLATHTQE